MKIRFLIFLLFLLFIQPKGFSDIDSIINSGVLKTHYNGSLVEYLLEEGQNKLSPEKKKEVLDQLVTVLKEKSQVTNSEQFSVALGALIGLGMQVYDDDIVSSAGSDVEQDYANEWTSWVDAALLLLKAGYVDDSVHFFEYGIQTIPYDHERARCVQGLAAAKPDQALEILLKFADEPQEPIRNSAIRMLGYLAVSAGINDEVKNQAVLKIIEKTQGLQLNTTKRAAIYALDLVKDPRSIELLGKFKKGLIDTYVQRAALKSLLVTFNDLTVVEILDKKLKSGFMSMNDPTDNLFAGLTLIQAHQVSGYEWAIEKLAPKKKGFNPLKKNKEPDFRSQIVRTLVRFPSDESLVILRDAFTKYEDDEWIKTWIATGLLELGDASYIPFVKSKLQNAEWDFTSIRIATALAQHGHYDGIPVLNQLTLKEPPKKGGAAKLFGALSGKSDTTQNEKNKLERLKMQVANAVATINHPDGLPILRNLLMDSNIYVRSSAAYALTRMTIDQNLLPDYLLAFNTEFGQTQGRSRNPIIHSYLLRLGALKYPEQIQNSDFLNAAKNHPDPSIQFLGFLIDS